MNEKKPIPKNNNKQDSIDLLIIGIFKFISSLNSLGLKYLKLYFYNYYISIPAYVIATIIAFKFSYDLNLFNIIEQPLIYIILISILYVSLIISINVMHVVVVLLDVFGYKTYEYTNWKDKQKIKKALFESGVTNEKGRVPSVLSKRSDGDLSIVTLNNHGLSSKEISLKIHKTEAFLGKRIIDVSPNPFDYSQSILKVEETRLTKKVDFENYQDLVKNRLDYVVGKSSTGMIIENISKAPNMAIFGATGGGKSNFFNSFICQQLLHSNFIQFYLFDFKNGIEFADYKDLPFCQLVTEHKHATEYLEKISYEMDRRYKNMKGRRILDYKFHKKDTILICIDEASELLNSKINKGLSTRCSELIARIGKLGRASGIHIIIGTQKPAQCHIPTELTTNLNQRMVFRLNDRADVVNALGKGSVDELGANPGLGIFRKGADKVQVQTLRIQDNEIREIVAKSMENSFFGPMLKECQSEEDFKDELYPELKSTNEAIEGRSINGDW